MVRALVEAEKLTFVERLSLSDWIFFIAARDCLRLKEKGTLCYANQRQRLLSRFTAFSCKGPRVAFTSWLLLSPPSCSSRPSFISFESRSAAISRVSTRTSDKTANYRDGFHGGTFNKEACFCSAWRFLSPTIFVTRPPNGVLPFVRRKACPLCVFSRICLLRL